MNTPLISCICVTRNRPHLLRRALRCFDAQTYPQKEIVLVVEEGDQDTAAVIQDWSRLQDKNMKLVTVAAGPDNRLGNLRNLGIATAEGTYFCQWDDDDWHHPERISLQYAQLVAAGAPYQATVLDQWIIFDAVHRQAYLGCKRHWEGSILCDRNFALQHKYHNLEKGEDSPLVDTLAARRQLKVITGHAHLYIYTFHGANTWDYGHFNGFMRYSQPLAAAQQDAVIRLMENDETAAQALSPNLY